ncbi:helix-turn-helix domain-containing protein [Flammeovirga kamogawensis]|uniref:Helix-turn-helix transcriptional regulator n=1 Tax=Flammeovirga kamogawensis TaxID=373891 RepID=A0ABX8GR27_9BACT|nr:helix-turn-helix transcriptional regulator [Flammeovirga kamogawensis]MBB6462739.1 AraC-like DNA-binding protein [Flammeovirga kamogawensis]QWG06028.1 helix-turn-helix transcriptional regulator [Flammeovirga kamogawensis]TRX67860.1 helix-turn-helix transcriptional regulator [Flammeovirga kamogawensis]
MKEVKYYTDINNYIKAIGGIPLMVYKDFYFVKFEDHEVTSTGLCYKHDYFEITLATGYKATFSINEQIIDTQNSHLFFAAPGNIITIDIEELEEDSCGYLILFNQSFLSGFNDIYNIYKNFPYFNFFSSSGYTLDIQQIKLFGDLFEKIYSEYDIISNQNIDIIKSYIMVLLHTAKKELSLDSTVNVFQNRYDKITYDFERIVIDTTKKYRTIDYYSEKLHISSIYLKECVKKSTGKTPKNIINEYVLLEAKSLLQQSTLQIDNVAYQLGFSDLSNFIKFFKRHTQKTPKSYFS